MDSIVKPLLTKVKAVNTNYGQIVQQLSVGDPAAKNRIKGLATDARKLFADFKGTISHMKSSVEMSPGFAPNVAVVVKMLAFFVKEVILVIQLFLELMKLITNILSLTTIINWFMKDLISAQKYLQRKKLWLERAVNRIKQKVVKNIEWVKRKITIKINKVFATAQKKYYEKQLEQLNQTSSKQTTTTSTTTTSSDKLKQKIVEQKLKQQKEQKEKIKTYLTDQIYQKDTEIKGFDKQLEDIEKEKVEWNLRWKEETEKDRKELLDDTPKLGVNHNG